MGINELIADKRDDILELAAQYGASNIRIFGSVARGTAKPDSDIDFLVVMEPDKSLFEMGGLLIKLQELLNRKVDIVTENGLHWYIKDNILKEAKPL